MRKNELTELDHWEGAQSNPPRMRLPSSWNVSILNTKRLLKRYIQPGMKVLEIGCAPGKMLSYCAAELRAEVAGMDYSRPGMRHAEQLFETLRLEADLRCEDMFAHTFTHHSFDLVYSLGVIEHFDDPVPVVEIHTQLLKPGAVTLIAVPNYAGFYGWFMKLCSPESLAIHNLDIMSTSALKQLVPNNPQYRARSWPSGKFSPWLIRFDKKLYPPAAFVISSLLNCVGLLQPFEINFICPMIVLEITSTFGNDE